MPDNKSPVGRIFFIAKVGVDDFLLRRRSAWGEFLNQRVYVRTSETKLGGGSINVGNLHLIFKCGDRFKVDSGRCESEEQDTWVAESLTWVGPGEGKDELRRVRVTQMAVVSVAPNAVALTFDDSAPDLRPITANAEVLDGIPEKYAIGQVVLVRFGKAHNFGHSGLEELVVSQVQRLHPLNEVVAKIRYARVDHTGVYYEFDAVTESDRVVFVSQKSLGLSDGEARHLCENIGGLYRLQVTPFLPSFANRSLAGSSFEFRALRLITPAGSPLQAASPPRPTQKKNADTGFLDSLETKSPPQKLFLPAVPEMKSPVQKLFLPADEGKLSLMEKKKDVYHWLLACPAPSEVKWVEYILTDEDDTEIAMQLGSGWWSLEEPDVSIPDDTDVLDLFQVLPSPPLIQTYIHTCPFPEEKKVVEGEVAGMSGERPTSPDSGYGMEMFPLNDSVWELDMKRVAERQPSPFQDCVNLIQF